MQIIIGKYEDNGFAMNSMEKISNISIREGDIKSDIKKSSKKCWWQWLTNLTQAKRNMDSCPSFKVNFSAVKSDSDTFGFSERIISQKRI